MGLARSDKSMKVTSKLRHTHNETALYYRHVTAFSFDLHVQPNRCFDYFTGQLNILRATRAVTV